MIDFDKVFVTLGEEWEKCIEFLEVKSFLEASYCLGNIRDAITGIMSSINNLCVGEKWGFFEELHIAPKLADYLQQDIQVLTHMQEIQDRDDYIDGFFPWDEMGDDEYPTGMLAMVFEMIDIRKQIEALGIMASNFLVYKGDESDQQEKFFAYAMAGVYRKLLYYGKIDKIYYQTGALTNNPEHRDSSDCTTRFQMIFTLHNLDKYILRVDMPHKGQPQIHINLNESKVENGGVKLVASPFPFLDDSEVAKELSFLGDNMFRLFYRQEHMVWFRNGFKELVSKTVMDETTKEFLYRLFDTRCHYDEPWRGVEIQESTVQSYLDKQRDYLEKWNLSNFNEVFFVKSDEIIEELGKLRWIDAFVQNIFTELCANKEYENMGHISVREMLWLIFDTAKDKEIMWQGRELTKQLFIETDMLQICKWMMSI